ncbi:MAG: hypothetical protein NVS3B20_21830 [Polyangiales bacterium]
MPHASETPDSFSIESSVVSDAELDELLALTTRESERIEAYPPRPPPRPVVPMADRALPKVMVAFEPAHEELVELVIRGGTAGEKALIELRRLGASALPPIMHRFPGPTRCDRHVSIADLPHPADAGPLLGLLVQLGHVALRDILARVGDPSPESRFWATYLLTEIVDVESAQTLIPRQVDDDASVRGVAVLAARALMSVLRTAAPLIIEPLASVLLDPGASIELRKRAATALGEMRDERAVQALILAVTEIRALELTAVCHDALVLITRHDPAQSGGTWPTWYARNHRRTRIEWLIEALMDEDLALREAAAAELKEITKVYFGYYANLPRSEREQAYRRYVAWWKDSGHEKHGFA